MIELLTGVPGAGKTYFAVYRLKSEYEKKSRPIFTNINLRIPFDDILQPFDVTDFHKFCKNELEFYEQYRLQQSERRKTDPDYDESDNYDEALKNSGLLEKYGNALILWDECHNDLDSVDDSYIRWMSYHRHFEGMDVLLITQNLSLIARKYKGFIDKYYFGMNAAKRLISTTFKYKVYTDHREYEKFYIETISLSSNRKIFEMYDSGYYKVNRSAALKKLAPIAILIFLLILFVTYFIGSKKQSDVNATSKPSPVSSFSSSELNSSRVTTLPILPPPPPLQYGPSISSQSGYTGGSHASLIRRFVRFQCTQSYCYFPGNRLTLSIGSMSRFLEEFGGKVLIAEPITSDLSIVTAVVPDELYYMIESHNIVSRSDNYSPQSQSNSFGGAGLTAPQFSPNQGI